MKSGWMGWFASAHCKNTRSLDYARVSLRSISCFARDDRVEARARIMFRSLSKAKSKVKLPTPSASLSAGSVAKNAARVGHLVDVVPFPNLRDVQEKDLAMFVSWHRRGWNRHERLRRSRLQHWQRPL